MEDTTTHSESKRADRGTRRFRPLEIVSEPDRRGQGAPLGFEPMDFETEDTALLMSGSTWR